MVVWFLLLVTASSVEITQGPLVTPAETSARITWTTDVECGTTVRFGLQPQQLTRKEEGSVGTNHAVELSGLQPGTTYHFTAGTAKRALQTGQFTTLGKATGATPPPKKTEATKPAPLPPAQNVKPPEPAKKTYTPPPAEKTWGDMDSLEDHYIRHGPDFQSRSAREYAAQAWLFLQRAKDEGLPAKQDDDGTIRIWDPKSRTFAAYNRDFTTKTYFRPNSSSYFERQPGRKVRVVHPPAKS
jgi:hypothetical protein